MGGGLVQRVGSAAVCFFDFGKFSSCFKRELAVGGGKVRRMGFLGLVSP